MNEQLEQTNSYYQEVVAILRNAAAFFVPLAAFPFGLLVKYRVVDSRFYVSDGIFAALVTAYLLASGLYFYFYFKRGQSKFRNYVLMTVILHMLTMLYILFVSGFLSAFLAVWIVLMISADLYFGVRGFLLSFATLCVTAFLSLLLDSQLSSAEQFEILQGILFIGVVGYVISKIRSVTDRERADLAVTREKEDLERERLLALINSMADGVIATNNSGVIRIYNAAAASILDTNVDLTGKPVDQVLKLRDAQKNPVKLSKLLTAGLTRNDLRLQFPDGDQIILYLNISPIHLGYHRKGERGYILLLRDITKEKTLEEERDEFMAVVSHELRTPVAIAEGSLSNVSLLFQKKASQNVIVGAVDESHKQIMYLAKMVNDLATLAHAERHSQDIEVEPVDLRQLIDEMQHNYGPKAQAKGLKLITKAPQKLKPLYTSQLYLREILQNVIVNAIKYTKHGKVTLDVHPMSNKTGKILFTVKDTGIGISKADQKHIFEKFFRSEDYRTRENNGTGLGLYLVKKLSEQIHAEVTFTSRLNHGSTFEIVVPSLRHRKKHTTDADGSQPSDATARSGPAAR